MTQSIAELAKRIIKEWLIEGPINYIIVVPPMSSPELLFQRLEDKIFIADVLGGNSENIKIASVKNADFSSEENFLKAMAKQWGVSINSELDTCQQLGHLTHQVIANDQIPVLLVERFHEAMERLGESFGAALRELNNDHKLSLKTVSGLPISKASLKNRWNLDDSKKPFLNSNWGDGFMEETIKGYSLKEITDLVKNQGGTEETANFIFNATAGLPKLVSLIIARAQGMSHNSFKHWVRSQTRRLSDPFFKWLDAKDSLVFTRLVANSLSCAYPKNNAVSLKDHSWKNIIEGPDGKAGCLILAWGCLDQFARNCDDKYFKSLADTVKKGKLDEALIQFEELAYDENPNWEIWKALELLCRIHMAADPYSLNCWKKAAQYLVELDTLGCKTNNSAIILVSQQLSKWSNIIRFMTELEKTSGAEKTQVLERYVCSASEKTKIAAFISLLKLRQKRVDMSNSDLALKSILTQPESIFQIYCREKLDVLWWNFEGMDEMEVTAISHVWRQKYNPPKKNTNLGFFDLLCLSFVRLNSLVEQERLVSDAEEFHRFNEVFQKHRNAPSHGTTLQTSRSDSDLKEYLEFCQQLLTRLKNILIGPDESIDLPEPMESFHYLAKNLVPGSFK